MALNPGHPLALVPLLVYQTCSLLPFLHMLWVLASQVFWLSACWESRGGISVWIGLGVGMGSHSWSPEFQGCGVRERNGEAVWSRVMLGLAVIGAASMGSRACHLEQRSLHIKLFLKSFCKSNVLSKCYVEYVKCYHVQLFVTPWTVAHQTPLSMGFCRQEYWSGLSWPPPGDLPNLGIEPVCPIAGRFFTIWTTREASLGTMRTCVIGWVLCPEAWLRLAVPEDWENLVTLVSCVYLLTLSVSNVLKKSLVPLERFGLSFPSPCDLQERIFPPWVSKTDGFPC